MTVSDFGAYLKRLRESRDLKLNELARLSDVSNAHISRIERGVRPAPSPEILLKFASALNVSQEEMLRAAGYLESEKDPIAGQVCKDGPKYDPDAEYASKRIISVLESKPELLAAWKELIGRDDLRLLFKQASGLTTLPILGRIKAGIPVLAEENWEGEVEIPSDIKADFALRISGDSMSWAGIADGDIAVLRKTDSPPNGAIVAAVIEEATWEATLKFFVRANGGAVLKAANPEYKDIPAGPKLKIIGQLVTLLKNPPTVSNYLAHLVHKDISDRKWQYAIELATQAGLDGESVANLINMVVKSAKQISK